MLLTYVDESYSKSHYWIVALVVPEYELVSLTASLDDAVMRAARNYSAIPTTAELHGHALFHAKDDWAPLTTMARARIGIYRDAFDAIAAHDVQIFIRGVHIPRLNERYIFPDHPHSVVLQHLLERVDEYAARMDELVLVIADEVDQADEHRKNLWRFQRQATPGYRSRRLTRIVDTMHFAPSSASRLVQGADLIAYMHMRIHSGVDQDERAKKANAALWEKIQPKIEHLYCWVP